MYVFEEYISIYLMFNVRSALNRKFYMNEAFGYALGICHLLLANSDQYTVY